MQLRSGWVPGALGQIGIVALEQAITWPFALWLLHHAITSSRTLTCPYEFGALNELANLMDALPEVGVVMPRILYPDGSMQYLCKLIPSPIDLLLRRFGARPWNWLFRDRMDRYNMRFFDHSQAVYVPVLSGCFMFARRSILDAVGGFDERFFLYMEDVDLCRRVGAISRLLFWPWITVVHGHAQGSYKSVRLLRMHIRSAIAYFNKWGWIKDADRVTRNKIGLKPCWQWVWLLSRSCNSARTCHLLERKYAFRFCRPRT